MGQYMCKLYTKKETKILLHGLGGAGKTTIVYLLKLGEVITTIPSIGFNLETVKYRNFSLTTWDVSGRDKLRPLFRHYYPNTNAMVFVIDSTDREGLEMIADEMHKALTEEVLQDAVFLILANKQDLEAAMSLDEIKKGLDYDKIIRDNTDKRINMFGCSAVTEDGQRDLYKALDWMCHQLFPPSPGWWWFWRTDKPTTDKPTTHEPTTHKPTTDTNSVKDISNSHVGSTEKAAHKTDDNDNIVQKNSGTVKT